MDNNSLNLMSEVMEKKIDSQTSKTQALTSLRDALENDAERNKSVERFFANGFRSDVRKILYDVRETQEQHEE